MADNKEKKSKKKGDGKGKKANKPEEVNQEFEPVVDFKDKKKDEANKLKKKNKKTDDPPNEFTDYKENEASANLTSPTYGVSCYSRAPCNPCGSRSYCPCNPCGSTSYCKDPCDPCVSRSCYGPHCDPCGSRSCCVPGLQSLSHHVVKYHPVGDPIFHKKSPPLFPRHDQELARLRTGNEMQRLAVYNQGTPLCRLGVRSEPTSCPCEWLSPGPSRPASRPCTPPCLPSRSPSYTSPYVSPSQSRYASPYVSPPQSRYASACVSPSPSCYTSACVSPLPSRYTSACVSPRYTPPRTPRPIARCSPPPCNRELVMPCNDLSLSVKISKGNQMHRY